MPALVVRPGATSPGANKIRARRESCESNRKERLLGLDNVRRDSDFATKDTDISLPESKSSSRSLAILKERVSRLGGGGAGTGLGDGYQAPPREQSELQQMLQQKEAQKQQESSLITPASRLVRQASLSSSKGRTGPAQGRNVRMQENRDSPGVHRSSGIYSSHVLGAYNWVKEVEAMSRQEPAMGETPKSAVVRTRYVQSVGPAKPESDTFRMRRLSVAPKSYGGQREVKELETAAEGEGGVGTRIMVYVRLRPMAKNEKDSGGRSCVRIVNKRDVFLTEFALETDYLRLKRVRGRHFAFDAAFPDNTTQQEVYNISTAGLVEGVLQGRNGSVFCYGATGAGKTHTMLGTVQSPGVMVLALKDLFAKIKHRSKDGDHVVRLSYLEVYNESVRDLLSPGRPLVLREDTKQGIVAAGLTQYQAYSADEVMSLLQRGNLNRTTEPTRVNETSSRSHAILQVVAEYKVQHETGCVTRAGKLSLIDLAGSERALATDQRTLRSVEGASINRSLLALSSCINALCEGKKHIPFRNSKLTQLLKDSLGGSCQTAMIANISPSNASFGETQNTLHWADRAKEICTKSCEANEELDVPESVEDKAKLLMDMQKENKKLRLQLTRLRQNFVTAQQAGASPSHTPDTRDIPQFAAHDSTTVEDQIQGSPALSQLVTSPPFTPAITASRDPAQGKTPGLHSSLSEQEFPERVTSERTIRDLQRTIQLLEMEADRARREVSRREEKHRAAIALIEQQHSLELQQKDDIIRKLCQQTVSEVVKSPLSVSTRNLLTPTTTTHTKSRLAATTEPTTRSAITVESIFSVPAITQPISTEPPSSVSVPVISKRPDVSPVKPLSRVSPSLQSNSGGSLPTRPITSYSKIDSKKQDLTSRSGALTTGTAAGTRLPVITEKVTRSRSSSNKIPALPPIRQVTKEARPRVVDPAPRRMSVSQHSARSPPLPRFCSPGKPGGQLGQPLPGCGTRKRSFWDITNTSPHPAPVTRASRRLSTATNSSSLLLQVVLNRERSYRAEFEDFNYC